MSKYGFGSNNEQFEKDLDKFIWQLSETELLTVAAVKVLETSPSNFPENRTQDEVLASLLANIGRRLGSLTLEGEAVACAIRDYRRNHVGPASHIA
jgi:hypothetical protein